MARSSRLQVKPFCESSKKCPRSLNGRQRRRGGLLGRNRLASPRLTPSATFNAAVPSAIRAFRRAYPEVDLTLEEANTTPLVTGLREGALDAVFVRPGTPDTEKLQLRRVAEEPVVIALAKRHPFAALEKIDLARLENDPFLLFSREIAPGLYDTVVNAC
jgi:DNA-binding transcriptional LysR family regulator